MILTEASYKHFRHSFYFLNFGWGKAIADLFIVSVVIGPGAAVKWVDVLVAIWLFSMIIFLPFISFCYREDEEAFVQKKMEESEKGREDPGEVTEDG